MASAASPSPCGVGWGGGIRAFQLTHLGSLCGKLRGFACSARPELPPRPEFQQGSLAFVSCFVFVVPPPPTFFPYSVKTNIVSRNFSLFVHGAVTEEGATMPLMINQKWNYPEVPFVVDLTFLTLC